MSLNSPQLDLPRAMTHICVRVAMTFSDAEDFMLITDNLIVLEREFAGTVGIQDMRMGGGGCDLG